MTSYQLVHTTKAPGSRRRPAGHASYAFELEVTRPPSSDGEASVWIVDARGILILPADQHRLGLAFVASSLRPSADPER